MSDMLKILMQSSRDLSIWVGGEVFGWGLFLSCIIIFV